MGIGTNAEKVPLNAYYRYGPPSFRSYSPECVEGGFSEVCLQNPAYPRSYRIGNSQ